MQLPNLVDYAHNYMNLIAINNTMAISIDTQLEQAYLFPIIVLVKVQEPI
jgi:hypothetical protein